MSMTSEEFWMGEACKFESWFYQANYARGQQEAENAKLRELVMALLTCATDGDCDECRMNGATPWHVGKAQLCDGVWERLRELGVDG